MKFNSYEFILVFLPVVLAGLAWLGRHDRHRAAMAWLVAASMVFYGWWNPAYLGLLLGSILFNFVLGERLARSGGRGLLAFGVAANLGLLGYYKYADFFVETAADAAGADWRIESLALPLAISFFTFQQIAYLVDVWKHKARDFGFLHYCLFVSFFPQLIAGPIVHHKEMMPQFDRLRALAPRLENIAVGLTFFVLGLAKKTLIADEMALIADPVFTAADGGLTVTFIEAWIGVAAFAFQIYFDFSGYSDMATGLARMVGIRLPVNFFSPYRAISVIDFWRRWHVTLSRFLRDYVYIPLGGNRKGEPRRFANLMITMVLGGLWHGAGWTFVAWGAIHGAMLAVNHLWRLIAPDARAGRLVRAASWAATFAGVTLAWAMFRSETMAGAWSLVRAMVLADGIALPDSYRRFVSVPAEALADWGVRFAELPLYDGRAQVALIVAVAALALLAPNTHQVLRRVHAPVGEAWTDPALATRRPRWVPSSAVAIGLGLVGALAIAGISRTSAFLYFNF